MVIQGSLYIFVVKSKQFLKVFIKGDLYFNVLYWSVQVGYFYEFLEGIIMYRGLFIFRYVFNVDDSKGDNDGNEDLVLN